MPHPSEGFLESGWKRILVFDGAMGTSLQQLELDTDAFGDHPGCYESLNLSRPDAVRRVHASFLAAGADIIKTNSFGGASHILAEHHLADSCERVNCEAARLARRAIDECGPGGQARFVAGSVGPGSKLPSLGHTTFDELRDSYLPQVRGLVEGGVDCLLVETCQDMLQARAVLAAVEDAFAASGTGVPVIVHFTLDSNGRTLTGSDIAAVLATFEPLGVAAIGLNCGTGPEPMAGAVRYLAGHSTKLLGVTPNAGMPRMVGGRATYDLEPGEFARQMASLASAGVNIVGGCCGTTAEHIRALAATIAGVPARGPAEHVPRLSSLYQDQPLDVRPKPLICGERTNASGSRKFRRLLVDEDYGAMVEVAGSQANEGAHIIDLSVATAGRSEERDIAETARRLNTGCRLPVMVDSTDPATVEAALKRLAGRCVVNSVNLDDVERTARTIELCRRYGACLVCMAIDEDGMAMTVSRKLSVARKLYDLALEVGLAPDALFFDFLTFTLASGDESLRESARETLGALDGSAKRLPGSFTLLGVSNVSHGLEPHARRMLNSVFLHRAIERGLDAAILHAGRILPLHELSSHEVELCDDLIFDRETGDKPPLQRFIEHSGRLSKHTAPDAGQPEKPRTLGELVLAGETEGLEAAVERQRAVSSPLDIINHQLLPAMERVGELFDSGAMLLPFVLRSAEVMKRACDFVTPHLDREDSGLRGTVVLATVRGDIHDIGKNLVATILASNGFRIVDLGVRQSPRDVLAAVREHRPLAVGLSGLLVESARAMKEYIVQFSEAGISIPVICGGAALSEEYVAAELQPGYGGTVHYAQNAMDGLRVVRDLDARPAPPETLAPPQDRTDIPAEPPPAPVPRHRLSARRYTRKISPVRLYTLVDRSSLFTRRWQSTTAGADAAGESERMLRRLWQDSRGIWQPRVRFAFFQALPSDDRLALSHQTTGRGLADLALSPGFVSRLRNQHGGQAFTMALQLVTVGPGVGERSQELATRGMTQEQFLLHGLAAEMTEALAQYCQQLVREQAGWPGARRYSPGYPVWPDLAEQQKLFRLLEPDKIGVSLTENFQMVPEYSTSAILVPSD